MRILLIADPLIPVPPRFYGGIERVVADIAGVYARNGHDVTLIAAPGSRSPGRLIEFGRAGEWTRWSNLRNFAVVARILRDEARRHDVIHNFGRLLYLTTLMRADVAKVQTYMRTVAHARIRATTRLRARRLEFTAVSDFIRTRAAVAGGRWHTIYNCAPVSDYRFRGDTDPTRAPLAFLGRLERCKGLHSAIAVAKAAGRQLRIAGNISDLPHERLYWEREIRPLIDGEQVQYLGPVDTAGKNELLGGAAAFLLPIEWDEPFPIVLPEALLCGTPVLAFARGGVPEGIRHGRTGFVCETVEQMAALIERVPELDRAECRRDAEQRYSAEAIAADYEALYRAA